MHDVVTAADADDLAAIVATRFLERIRDAQLAHRSVDVALTGGTVARTVHRAIAAESGGFDIDWSQVAFWFGDERFVPRDDPERNAGQARTDLLDRIGATRVHEIPASDDVATAAEAADIYAALLRGERTGGFDLVMLGMGPDGHVASLFPGSPELDERTQLTAAVLIAPKPPPQRVSLTFAALNDASAVWFLVSGAEKAAAVERSWAFEGSIDQTPARGIRGPSVTWFVDQTANPGQPIRR